MIGPLHARQLALFSNMNFTLDGYSVLKITTAQYLKVEEFELVKQIICEKSRNPVP